MRDTRTIEGVLDDVEALFDVKWSKNPILRKRQKRLLRRSYRKGLETGFPFERIAESITEAHAKGFCAQPRLTIKFQSWAAGHANTNVPDLHLNSAFFVDQKDDSLFQIALIRKLFPRKRARRTFGHEFGHIADHFLADTAGRRKVNAAFHGSEVDGPNDPFNWTGRPPRGWHPHHGVPTPYLALRTEMFAEAVGRTYFGGLWDEEMWGHPFTPLVEETVREALA